jgi:hypothetical protein
MIVRWKPEHPGLSAGAIVVRRTLPDPWLGIAGCRRAWRCHSFGVCANNFPGAARTVQQVVEAHSGSVESKMPFAHCKEIPLSRMPGRNEAT